MPSEGSITALSHTLHALIFGESGQLSPNDPKPIDEVYQLRDRSTSLPATSQRLPAASQRARHRSEMLYQDAALRAKAKNSAILACQSFCTEGAASNSTYSGISGAFSVSGRRRGAIRRVHRVWCQVAEADRSHPLLATSNAGSAVDCSTIGTTHSAPASASRLLVRPPYTYLSFEGLRRLYGLFSTVGNCATRESAPSSRCVQNDAGTSSGLPSIAATWASLAALTGGTVESADTTATASISTITWDAFASFCGVSGDPAASSDLSPPSLPSACPVSHAERCSFAAAVAAVAVALPRMRGLSCCTRHRNTNGYQPFSPSHMESKSLSPRRPAKQVILDLMRHREERDKALEAARTQRLEDELKACTFVPRILRSRSSGVGNRCSLDRVFKTAERDRIQPTVAAVECPTPPKPKPKVTPRKIPLPPEGDYPAAFEQHQKRVASAYAARGGRSGSFEELYRFRSIEAVASPTVSQTPSRMRSHSPSNRDLSLGSGIWADITFAPDKAARLWLPSGASIAAAAAAFAAEHGLSSDLRAKLTAALEAQLSQGEVSVPVPSVSHPSSAAVARTKSLSISRQRIRSVPRTTVHSKCLVTSSLQSDTQPIPVDKRPAKKVLRKVSAPLTAEVSHAVSRASVLPAPFAVASGVPAKKMLLRRKKRYSGRVTRNASAPLQPLVNCPFQRSSCEVRVDVSDDDVSSTEGLVAEIRSLCALASSIEEGLALGLRSPSEMRPI